MQNYGKQYGFRNSQNKQLKLLCFVQQSAVDSGR